MVDLFNPNKGAGTYNYDSIIYYNNGITNVDYFVIMSNDTLLFSSVFRSLVGSGVKAYFRQSN